MKYGIAHGLDVDMLAFSKPFFLAACSPTLKSDKFDING